MDRRNVSNLVRNWNAMTTEERVAFLMSIDGYCSAERPEQYGDSWTVVLQDADMGRVPPTETNRAGQ